MEAMDVDLNLSQNRAATKRSETSSTTAKPLKDVVTPKRPGANRAARVLGSNSMTINKLRFHELGLVGREEESIFELFFSFFSHQRERK